MTSPTDYRALFLQGAERMKRRGCARLYCGHSNWKEGRGRKEGEVALQPARPCNTELDNKYGFYPHKQLCHPKIQCRRLGRPADAALLGGRRLESEPGAGGGQVRQEWGNCPAGDGGEIVQGWGWRKINCSGNQTGTLLPAT